MSAPHFCEILLKTDSPLPPLQEREKPDSPLTPLQERGIVTTGKRGLSVPAIAEHPLSPPGTVEYRVQMTDYRVIRFAHQAKAVR